MSASKKTKTIAIVYWSLFGNVRALADSIKRGVDATGCEGRLFQLPETYSKEKLEKMKAPPPDEKIPYLSLDDLRSCDGFLLGIMHFGECCEQFLQFWKQADQFKREAALLGKPYGFFSSTKMPNESGEIKMIPTFSEYGMLYVPFGDVNSLDRPSTPSGTSEPHGCSLWGSGSLAFSPLVNRSRPSTFEEDMCERQGQFFATIASRLS